MSANWPRVPLGEVLKQNGEPTQVTADGVYPNLGIYSFGRGLFEKLPILGTATSAKTLYRVRAGQFIYSRLFAFEGAYGLVPQELDGHFVSNEFPAFDVDANRVSPSYLAHYFSRRAIWSAVAEHSTGMGHRRQRVQPEQLLKYVVPLPPLAEQRRIVSRVDAIAARITDARNLHESAVKDVGALRAGVAQRYFADVAVSHSVRPLGELVSVRGGGTPSKSNPLYWQGSIPWVSPKDMKLPVIADATDHLSHEAVADSSAKLLDPGAVLIVVRGMILARAVPVAVLQVPATINQDMKALIPNADIDSAYLRTALAANEPNLLQRIEKSTHDTRKLETEQLLSLPLPVPPLAEQHRIVAHLDALQAKADALRGLQAEASAELDALLPAVLAKAFAGEL